jgi:hypothetical protein
VLCPSLIGFLGYGLTRRHLRKFLGNAPAVARLREEHIRQARAEQTSHNGHIVAGTTWKLRLLQFAMPVACLLAYLLWSGLGFRREALEHLILPVTTRGILLILPYALLVPVLLLRDPIQIWWFRRSQARLLEK